MIKKKKGTHSEETMGISPNSRRRYTWMSWKQNGIVFGSVTEPVKLTFKEGDISVEELLSLVQVKRIIKSNKGINPGEICLSIIDIVFIYSFIVNVRDLLSPPLPTTSCIRSLSSCKNSAPHWIIPNPSVSVKRSSLPGSRLHTYYPLTLKG